jgi:hypothetical protein
MVSARDDEHRHAAQRRLEAAKAWQRRILRENANQPAPETD